MFYPDGDRFLYEGTEVRFLNKNGYDFEREQAAAIFDTDKTYTISGVDIGNWSSTYQFEGIPGHFNTVMFAKA